MKIKMTERDLRNLLFGTYPATDSFCIHLSSTNKQENQDCNLVAKLTICIDKINLSLKFETGETNQDPTCPNQ